MSDKSIADIRARHAAPATEHGLYYGFAHNDVGILLQQIDAVAAALAESQELQKRHFEERNHYRDLAFTADGELREARAALAWEKEENERALKLACEVAQERRVGIERLTAELERLRAAIQNPPGAAAEAESLRTAYNDLRAQCAMNGACAAVAAEKRLFAKREANKP